jgi:RNA polymerase sigma-70 factor (ECF subfamily)
VDLAQDVERRRRFERLVTDVYAPLQRYLLRRADPTGAEDVLGDVLLVLWRRLDDVPPESPLPWAYGVARGCLANHLRGAARQERLLHRLAQQPQHPEADDDGRLQQALEALPEADQEVLRLWAWEQLPPREIALAMGLTANAVSLRLHRAKRRLKKLLTSGKETGPAGQIGMRDGGGAKR